MVSYKEQKEAFVTGHEGTTPAELLLICSSVPIGAWAFTALVGRPSMTHSSSTPLMITITLAVEALCFGIPMILCQSNLLYPWGVAYLITLLAVGCVLRWIIATTPPNQPPRSTSTTSASLTVYRACLLYLTFVAILAVDFHVFPRRGVKTEVRGYSLMDLGAASFVVAAGLVSRRARHGQPTQAPSSWRLTRALRSRLLPLLALGSLRLLTHKGLEYQEHASEYGVHWNFFFTLAVCTVTASLGSHAQPTWWVPTLIMALYQMALSWMGWQHWVETAPRACTRPASSTLSSGFGITDVLCDWMVANREGMLGCIAFSSLFMFSEWIGYRFLWRHSPTSKTLGTWPLASLLVALTMIWRLLVFLGVPVSRRTTNAAFCCWTLLVNMLQLWALQLVYQGHENDEGMIPPILQQINRHGLVSFVAANLLTGLVNLSIHTLAVSDGAALVILTVYIMAVGVVTAVMDVILSTASSAGQVERKNNNVKTP